MKGLNSYKKVKKYEKKKFKFYDDDCALYYGVSWVQQWKK